MAMKWDGFSEEDITNMKIHSDESGINHTKIKDADLSHNGQKRSNQKFAKKISQNQSTSAQLRAKDTNGNVDSAKFSSDLKVNRMLGSPETGHEAAQKIVECSQECTQDQLLKNNECSTVDTKPLDEFNEHQKKSLTAKLVLPSLSQPTPSSINLSDFKTKHRLMEEQNRARKVFLAKALEDRKKQTHAEQLRLSMIQEELQKLDQRLSCDVSIIRNQIEAASLEFMEAQKRYDRAEKEFLDAKLLLYTKLERKELLTHHLCTIIEQNEMRKAQKLSELMEKLQMPDADGCEVQDGQNEKHNPSNLSNNEVKRKVSSEIILTPISVISQSEACKHDGTVVKANESN